ncbi:MAG: divalent metal cation transporter [Gemmatimonadota bacterium]|nr:divalent metal cation transporter [Gemmatimonadota bacterium]
MHELSAPLTATATRHRARLSVLLGAAFLMATSAIGPGFLTQTVVFTQQLGASFGFAILVSVLFDLAAQLNVWRVITASGRRAQDLANDMLPGLGHALAVLVALGGLAFNVGNVAGCGLGLNAALGLPVAAGALLSAGVAVVLFVAREAGRAMDRFAQLLGAGMIGLSVYVAIASRPPVGEALLRSVAPSRLDALAIVTIVGGTVGGYITFAGAHRLLDAGVKGPDTIREVTRSAISGIAIASLMRVVLFLAALGVVARGAVLAPDNPPASVFRIAAGGAGYVLFGAVMWSAAITSVVGSSYTSISFLRSLGPTAERHWPRLVVAFIAVSTAIFLAVGRPVRVLILVGALNGLILPISLGVMLAASRSSRIVGSYRHPRWLVASGVVVVAAMLALGLWTMATLVPKLFA